MRTYMPFRGAEAIAAGRLNRHQLRTHFRALFPGVYLHRDVAATLYHRTVAAWLWSRRRGVVAGQAAAALLGVKFVDESADIELVCTNSSPPSGILTRKDVLNDDEITNIRGMRVTSAARTAFDLARRGRLEQAVARVDAILKFTRITVADIERVAARHPGARGMRQLEQVLALADAGAASPRETWLRLLLRRADFPPLRTQFRVFDERRVFVGRVDLSWPDLKIAIEYDGQQHRTDPDQYARDVRRLERLHALNWIVIRVLKGDSEEDIIKRVRVAYELRMSEYDSGRRDPILGGKSA